MVHYLTDEELQEILKDPCPPTILGFGGYVYAHKVDIYTFYLCDRFTEIDKKYCLKKQRNDNKGLKGELLMCGIIDLTMWRFGFRLGQDYTVTHAKKKKKEVDFKLTCLDTLFLCEAKNWAETTWIDKRNYSRDIRTRFSDDGINVLMIRKDRVADVETMYKQYSTVNRRPINYIEIDNFMDVNRNDIYEINLNLMFGINQLTSIVARNIGIDRDFNLIECLQMGMPNWFISEYTKKSTKTINRQSKKLGYDRKSQTYKKQTKYRDIS